MASFNSGTNSLYADALFWSGATSVTFPVDPDFTRSANFALEKVSSVIMRSDGTWKWGDINNTDLSFAIGDLVSGQSDYALSISHFKIRRVRIKDSNGNWITLQPVTRRQVSDSKLASTGTPNSYFKHENSIILSDTPNYDSEDGLEIEFQRGVDYFVVGDTTKSPGFNSQFHRLVSLYAALDWTEANEMDSRSEKIRNRIGVEPDEVNGIPGSGMLRELADFYSTRDDDASPAMSLRREDYGSSALGGYNATDETNPRGF